MTVLFRPPTKAIVDATVVFRFVTDVFKLVKLDALLFNVPIKERPVAP